MKLALSIFLIFLTQISCSGQNSIWPVGNRNSELIFVDSNNGSQYAFNGGFRELDLKCQIGEVVYINDEVVIYLKKNKVTIEMPNGRSTFRAKEEINRIICDSSGDNVFYTSGDEELSEIMHYSSRTKKISELGLMVDYESFWWSEEDYLIYSVFNDENYSRELFKVKFTNNHGVTNEKVEFLSNTFENYLGLSKDGTKVCGVVKIAENEHGVLDIRSKKVEKFTLAKDSFIFFFKNSLFYFNPSKLEAFLVD